MSLDELMRARMAYRALLDLPLGSATRADPAIQSAMATLRDRIAFAEGAGPETVQNATETASLPQQVARVMAGNNTAAMLAQSRYRFPFV